MKSFTDTKGQVWDIDITIGPARRVKSRLGVDLNTVIDNKAAGLVELLTDPYRLVDVLFVLCEAQAVQRQISDQDFADVIGGDVLEAAANAFVEALIDFFPHARIRANLRAWFKAAKQMREKMLTRAELEISRINPDTEADKLIDSLIGQPASSASTPSHSPSDSLSA